jgi:Domain of unknown function (DUF4349)
VKKTIAKSVTAIDLSVSLIKIKANLNFFGCERVTNTNQFQPKSPRRSQSVVLALAMGGVLALTSCSSAPTTSASSKIAAPAASVASGITLDQAKDAAAPNSSAANQAINSEQQATKSVNKPSGEATNNNNVENPALKPQKPQLIKTAYVSLKLDSIDQALIKIRELSQSKGGDIYSFQDNQSADRGDHRKANLVVKVPVASLDQVLASIAKLGKVQNQKLESNDVTQQIVDSDARLKNLRQQEDQTRKIMERAGSINDTLRVSQSLAGIREQIEQIDAQVKNMRQQVAYSTINLELEELQAANPSGDPFGLRVQETWKNSTGTAGSLATGIMLTVLWLLPFTPLFAAGGAGFYWFRRRQKAQIVTNQKLIEVEEAK